MRLRSFRDRLNAVTAPSKGSGPGIGSLLVFQSFDTVKSIAFTFPDGAIEKD
jgi:hypothetical protein